jgi:hypothetical protein
MRKAAPLRIAALGLALAAALAAALAVGGCGSGGGGTSTTGPASSSTSAPTSTATAPATSAGGHAEAHAGGHAEAGGEKSIEDYGSESAGSGREALLAAFHGYLKGLAARDYTTACNYLAASVRRSLEQLVTKQLKAKGCPGIMPKLLAPTAAAIARRQANGKVTKLRVRGSRAFVVYHAPGAKLYVLTMTREGGGWKAALLAGSVLVPSPATLGR